jgi:MoaA/NifB/PqqE/SkfB family radical SAM enzyme
MSLAQQFLRKIPQYTRHSRHLWSVTNHGNPKKWANLLAAEYERKMRRIHVQSSPYLLIIDACNFCNLKCPLCPTGLNDLGRQQSMLSFEHFQKYFDPLSPWLFEAYLHNWGESLLNKQVYRMIEYAQQRNVGTNLSSNFVKVSSQDIDNILDSGLEYLVISLDGTSQETYGKYRIGGNYEQVIENLSELIRRRDRLKKKTPVIEWQFIVMKQNEHQVGEAEVLAKKLGVDLLRFIPVGMPYEVTNRKEVADKWYPATVSGRNSSDHEEQQFGQAGKPGPCFYLYRSMVINSDGGVSPCCVVYRKNRDFADLNQAEIDIRKIWNNEKYVSGRALFSSRNPEKKKTTVCDGCDIFERHPKKRLQPVKENGLLWPAGIDRTLSSSKEAGETAGGASANP